MEKWKRVPSLNYHIHQKLYLIVTQEQKLFLALELKVSLRIIRLFPRTITASLDISTFFLRFSGSPSQYSPYYS